MMFSSSLSDTPALFRLRVKKHFGFICWFGNRVAGFVSKKTSVKGLPFRSFSGAQFRHHLKEELEDVQVPDLLETLSTLSLVAPYVALPLIYTFSNLATVSSMERNSRGSLRRTGSAFLRFSLSIQSFPGWSHRYRKHSKRGCRHQCHL